MSNLNTELHISKRIEAFLENVIPHNTDVFNAVKEIIAKSKEMQSLKWLENNTKLFNDYVEKIQNNRNLINNLDKNFLIEIFNCNIRLKENLRAISINSNKIDMYKPNEVVLGLSPSEVEVQNSAFYVTLNDGKSIPLEEEDYHAIREALKNNEIIFDLNQKKHKNKEDLWEIRTIILKNVLSLNRQEPKEVVLPAIQKLNIEAFTHNKLRKGDTEENGQAFVDWFGNGRHDEMEMVFATINCQIKIPKNLVVGNAYIIIE